MRLFIALNFDEPTKDKLCDTMQRLKMVVQSGKFTLRDNLHLTVAFIGEVQQAKLQNIKAAMSKVEEKPFSLHLGGVGCFRRDNGSILWVGADKSRALLSIHDQLCERLSKSGFAVEMREYKPHLTLAREFTLPEGFDLEQFSNDTEQIKMQVKSIDLMKSERVNGKLTYTRIYEKLL